MTSNQFSQLPPAELWDSVDPLGAVLHLLRMSSVFYTRSEFSNPWSLALPEMPGCLMFHMVTSGRCILRVGESVYDLQPGDFALIPRGLGHVICSSVDATSAALFDLPREQLSERYEILRHGGGGEDTGMLCGTVRFEEPAAQYLVNFLPSVLMLETRDSPQRGWIESLLQLMASEAQTLQPGGESVITRLADVLVIYAIRLWIANDPAAQTGWLGALRDRQIGRAILHIHREPARAWTVATLAALAAMSRSAFAARFKEVVGLAPMNYLAQWRVQVAAAWLREEGATVANVAGRLGYESEAAFSRAFKRCLGVSPGAMRRLSSA